jgi:hypothetical protein
MVELNHRDRQIKVKIVYYGPPLGGKTTNLQILHQHADAARRGDMISINSAARSCSTWCRSGPPASGAST